MKTKKEQIKNSIRAYIIGDALGVPFEFRKKGTFKCKKFEGFLVHYQKEGTWSDDTSILLCLMEAMTYSDELLMVIQRYKHNLIHWYHNDEFTVSGLFDIGNQITESILSEFKTKKSSNMGNGALFYSLPLACLFLNKDDKVLSRKIFEKFCSVTHCNENCFEFGFKFSLLLKNLFLSLSPESSIYSYENKGDVINTYNLIVDQFLKRKDKDTSLFEDLCEVVNLGQDTDTNAALFGALMGNIKPVLEKDWKQIQRHEYIDHLIDHFLNSLGL